MGFKPKNLIKPYFHVRPAQFLYPDEMVCLDFVYAAGLLFFFFLIWGGTCSLLMPALRPASQAGPMRNPREGTSVVLRDTVRLT